jgi:hypothetical protein
MAVFSDGDALGSILPSKAAVRTGSGFWERIAGNGCECAG